MQTVPESKAIKGWWFGGDTLPNGDGRQVAVGAVHRVEPPIRACKRGLHCSVDILDALSCADCCTIWRVEVWGEVDDMIGDKLAAEYRRYLWSVDGEAVLRRFACRTALEILPADADQCIREYLTLEDRATEYQRCAAERAAGAHTPSPSYWAAELAADAVIDRAADMASSASQVLATHAIAYDRRQNARLTAMVIAEHRRQEAIR